MKLTQRRTPASRELFMRVFIVHNQYQHRGGEDVVVEDETRLLRAAGHAVETFIVSNDSIVSFADKVGTVLRALDNIAITRELDNALASFLPDVVHFHNVFPRLTPGAILCSLKRGYPTVQTLHNYRHICAEAAFLRNDQICQSCLGTRWRLPALQHRCYRGSLAGTYSVIRIGKRVRYLFDTYPRHFTLIALTNFARAKMQKDGFAGERIFVKGNSSPDPGSSPEQRDKRIIFLGRLNHEKGADLLVQAAPHIDAIVEIIGDGPERASLMAAAPANVKFRGQLGRDGVIEALKRATAIAVPSRWFESCPMVVLEAFSTATPVVAPSIGPLAELIEHERSGVVVENHTVSSWINALQGLTDNPQRARKLGLGARAAYEARFSEARNLERLTGIYEAAIRQAVLSTR